MNVRSTTGPCQNVASETWSTLHHISARSSFWLGEHFNASSLCSTNSRESTGIFIITWISLGNNGQEKNQLIPAYQSTGFSASTTAAVEAIGTLTTVLTICSIALSNTNTTTHTHFTCQSFQAIIISCTRISNAKKGHK